MECPCIRLVMLNKGKRGLHGNTTSLVLMGRAGLGRAGQDNPEMSVQTDSLAGSFE